MLETLVRRIAGFYTRRWSQDAPGIRSRQYATYEQYLEHQASKLSAKPARAIFYDDELEKQLKTRIDDLHLEGARVLCLGARLGGEVRAFRAAGAFAWGVDLNPGPDNPYVAFGDFQRLQLPDNSCDVAFSNSLDHAQRIESVLVESRRVLRDGGTLVLELMNFDAEPPAHWESTYWESVEDVIRLAGSSGLRATSQQPFDAPWRGMHVRFVAD